MDIYKVVWSIFKTVINDFIIYLYSVLEFYYYPMVA